MSETGDPLAPDATSTRSSRPEPAASKTSAQENFPVGSRLLKAEYRPHVLAFYRFARTADDIADAPDLSADDKLARLDAMEAALDAPCLDPRADALRKTEAATGCGVAQARALLAAFRQDAVKARYRDWDDLADYCRLSANPVGRFLLTLHGEGVEAHGPSDALCTALQVLNHLQDCADDRTTLGRVYIPEPWLVRAGGEDAFFAPGSQSSARRAVLDAALDRVDDALDQAADLPATIADRRLRMEAGVTLTLARRLAERLREADPVAERVALGPRDFAVAAASTPLWAMRHGAGHPSERADQTVVRNRVRRARTSFAAGMRSLPGDRRAALYAIYAFARAVDDVADAPTPPAERLERLGLWRDALDRVRDGTPKGPLERELDRAVTRFGIPLIELDRLIDGMEDDCAACVRKATPLALSLYCRRVAGTVGIVSAHVFGLFDAPTERRTAHRFARTLAQALQRINVLRDIREDAAEDRAYLPTTSLGLQPDAPIEAVLCAPRLAQTCTALARDARARIATASALSTTLDDAALRPARLMLAAYEGLLDEIEGRIADGECWPLSERVRLSPAAKLRLAAGALLPAMGRR